MPLQIIQRYALLTDPDSKAIDVPAELIKEVHGVKYLKLAAGSGPIIKAIFGECPKNASLASSSVLARLITERNTKQQACDTTDAPAAVDELFGQQPKKRQRARKRVFRHSLS